MNILQVPEECLIEIFKHLRGEDLKSLSLTHPNFYKLIISTRCLNSKLLLKVTSFHFSNSNRSEWESVVEKSERTFQEIVIIQEINNATVLVTKKFGEHIVRVNLRRLIAPTIFFAVLLRNFPDLEEIVVESSGAPYQMPELCSELIEVPFLKLKSLEFRNPPFSKYFIDVFSKAINLTTLKISGVFPGLLKFLQNQKCLKVLSIYDRDRDNTIFSDEEFDTNAIQYKLAEFSYLVEVENPDSRHHTNFQNFIQQQNKIHTLVLHIYGFVDHLKLNQDLVKVFEVESLKKIEIRLPYTSVDHPTNFCNSSVEKFITSLYSFDKNFFDHIYQLFPNLKELVT